MPDTATTTQSTDHLLAVYLRDHFAGAAAGLALAQRCQRANDGTPLGAILADIAAEIEADRDSLRDIMKSLAVSEDWLKDVLGQASEFVGRLKSNGMLAHYSPSSRRRTGGTPRRHRRQAQSLAVAARCGSDPPGARRRGAGRADHPGELATRAPPGRA